MLGLGELASSASRRRRSRRALRVAENSDIERGDIIS
jgi:hypothetical protein